ncbi:hypothetical protein Ciccas_001541 [Cichlidogyrus casuarinus]|uniref:Uncharacterized protein n=1 Tax=Cichlidogyrus casuarinus TaxID=1844966 RepID=A0ABD2QJW4_9PLAT
MRLVKPTGLLFFTLLSFFAFGSSAVGFAIQGRPYQPYLRPKEMRRNKVLRENIYQNLPEPPDSSAIWIPEVRNRGPPSSRNQMTRHHKTQASQESAPQIMLNDWTVEAFDDYYIEDGDPFDPDRPTCESAKLGKAR